MGAAAFSSGKQRSGKGFRLQVQGSNLDVKNVDVTHRAEDLDTTNSESAGFETGTDGIEGLDWNADADWDAGRNFYDVQVGVYPRDDLGVTAAGAGTATKIWENVTDNVSWTIPTSRVISSQNSMPVKGTVAFKWTAKSNGSFTLPTGSI